MARPTDQPPLLLAALALVAVVGPAAAAAAAATAAGRLGTTPPLHPTKGHATVVGKGGKVGGADAEWLRILCSDID